MLALSFRAKLTAIVVTAAVAFAVMIVSSSLIASRSDREIEKIQQRYLPKMALAPQIEAEFERLRRALQDAVGARDVEALTATRVLFDQILERLTAAREVLEPRAAEALTRALNEYYDAASEVSRRLIAGETGEGLVGAMSAMQAMQARVAEDLKSATTLDRGELTRAFASAARAQVTAGRVRFAISALCLLSVILLSFWVGRGLLLSLDRLAAGLGRFGRGDFARPIEGVGADELGQVAQQANRMAESLRRMGEQREQASWLKNLEAGLGQELRGALEPDEVARRAVQFLARALEARAAALYYADPGPQLRLLAHYALSPAPDAAPSFNPGEGLVGQAALQERVMLVEDPPPNYLRVRSGLGEAAPRVIALVPLVHLGRVAGVLELASFSPWSERSAEAVQAVQEMLVISIEVARARAATRQLLAETQRQAQRLTEQEEELRAANEGLQSQQQELRQSNRELTNQADELEAQRTKLEESNTELDEARRGLEHKARELATVSAYKSQFLANMSHELRTPLNSMLLLSNLLAENQGHNLTEKQVEFAATIHAAGKDLLALINQVLDLAKIEAGKSEVQIAPASLRDLVTSMERVFAPLAADKGLRLRTELGPDLPESILTDRRRVEQILKNLIGNAIKFTARGEVVVRLGLPGPQARLQRAELEPRRTLALSVSDTGVGIAPEHRERVFVPFEQVDSAPDRRYGGTGLGLSISRELASLLGGELQLESVVGRGSTFTCFLPFDPPAPATAPAAATEPAPATAAAEGAGAAAAPAPALLRTGSKARTPSPARLVREKELLLVIEDDSTFGEALADIIREQGLDCLLAEDGQAGLRLARERRPAGIILDVNLPDLDGWRIMERLRADPATAAIPVHFVSGVDAPERGLALGAVGYLTKPAAPEDLARAVRALSAKGTEHARRVLVVEDDVVVAEALSRQLAGEKLEVQRAGNAAEALAALEAQRFACMILDLSLPDMDGMLLLRALRVRHGAGMPAVVIYTARALSDDEIRTLGTSAEAVVLKDGASADRLLDEVRVFVRRLQEGRVSTKRVATAPSPSALHLEGKKVLIVDDDMRTVYALSATLRAKGADVAVAENGQVALNTLVDRPDLQAVLMDIMMPEMDGYETIRRIRRDERHRELPIIALTAKAMKGDEEQCRAAGASDYLPKPVDVDRLLVMLDKLLSPRAPVAPP